MQRYFSKEKLNNNLIISDYDLYHIKTVMRLKPDDLIEVVYKDILYICKLTDDYNASIILEKEKDKKNSKIILCLPLLHEQKMSFVIQKATELGIDEIIPIVTERSMVKIDLKEEKKLVRWNKICKEASEQSKRLTIPFIRNLTKIEDLNLEGFKLVCSTQEKTNNLKKVFKCYNKCDTIVIVVGPEGGLTVNEEKKLNELGFKSISLGKNIMRVETVPIFFLSVINYELME